MTETRKRWWKPGPQPTFDKETLRRRRHAQNYRARVVAGKVADYVAEHHPKIFQQAKNHAEAAVLAKYGPLPGDEPTEDQ